ncbi:MAG TPA: ATPase, partial [Erysipelotrichaceae bacterium]|nr:ATPase [Erysipelotrichaceae bacterium]
ETYLKDIVERNQIEKTQELEDLINILASAIGSLTNPPKIEATFRSTIQSKISLNTIRQYI